MKHKSHLAVLAFALVVMPLTVRADDSHANMVMQHGAQVMPFDQSQATHMFLPDPNGGVLEIVVHDMDQTQISLVRSHLLKEAAQFTSGNYSDPAYIHGQTMPGLDQLQSGALRVSVRYFETPEPLSRSAVRIALSSPRSISGSRRSSATITPEP